MNLYVVTPDIVTPNSGGVSRVLHLLLPVLCARGFQVMVLYQDNQNAQFDEPTDIPQVGFPQQNPAHKENVVFLNRLLLRSDEKSIIWIHSHLNDQIDCCNLARSGTDAKIIYTLHQNPFVPLLVIEDELAWLYTKYVITSKYRYLLSWGKYCARSWLKRKHISRRIRYSLLSLAKKVDSITTLSYSHSRSISLLLEGQPCPMEVVPNPVSLPSSTSFEKEKILLVVARLTWQKRVDRVLLAWKKLQDDFPDWKLIVVGGENSPMYRDLTTKLELRRVTFTGQTDATPYQERASILCLPSSYEALPMVLLEAIAFDCIPVCFDSVAQGFDEQVRKYLQVVYKKSPTALENKLRDLMRMVDSGQSSCIAWQKSDKYAAIEDLSVERIVDHYVQFFKEMILL